LLKFTPARSPAVQHLTFIGPLAATNVFFSGTKGSVQVECHTPAAHRWTLLCSFEPDQDLDGFRSRFSGTKFYSILTAEDAEERKILFVDP
jgi:hypothetical protein